VHDSDDRCKEYRARWARDTLAGVKCAMICTHSLIQREKYGVLPRRQVGCALRRHGLMCDTMRERQSGTGNASDQREQSEQAVYKVARDSAAHRK